MLALPALTTFMIWLKPFEGCLPARQHLTHAKMSRCFLESVCIPQKRV